MLERLHERGFADLEAATSERSPVPRAARPEAVRAGGSAANQQTGSQLPARPPRAARLPRAPTGSGRWALHADHPHRPRPLADPGHPRGGRRGRDRLDAAARPKRFAQLQNLLLDLNRPTSASGDAAPASSRRPLGDRGAAVVEEGGDGEDASVVFFVCAGSSPCAARGARFRARGGWRGGCGRHVRRRRCCRVACGCRRLRGRRASYRRRRSGSVRRRSSPRPRGRRPRGDARALRGRGCRPR